MQSRIEVYGDFAAAVALHRLRRMDWWHREQEGAAGFDHRAATHETKTRCHAALGRVRLLTTRDDVSIAASELLEIADEIHPSLSPEEFAAHRERYFAAVTSFLTSAGSEVRAGR
jgi:hypothetical protein